MSNAVTISTEQDALSEFMLHVIPTGAFLSKESAEMDILLCRFHMMEVVNSQRIASLTVEALVSEPFHGCPFHVVSELLDIQIVALGACAPIGEIPTTSGLRLEPFNSKDLFADRARLLPNTINDSYVLGDDISFLWVHGGLYTKKSSKELTTH